MMKLMPSIKERLRRTYFSLLIFYLFLIFFTVIIPIIVHLIDGNASLEIDLGDISIPTAAYSAAVGAIMVKQGFNSAIQMGSSRKSIFTSYIVSSVIISASMMIINTIFIDIFKNVGWLHTRQLIAKFYGIKDYSLPMLGYFLVCSLTFLLVGIFIGLLIQRVKNQYLMITSAFIIFLGIGILNFVKNMPVAFQKDLLDYVLTITGIKSNNLNILSLTFLIISVIITCCIWLIIRRQPAK